MEKATLQELLESRLKDIFSIEIAEASPQELFLALANVVKSCYANDWSQTRKICSLNSRNRRIISRSNFYLENC